jgi:hypothetical protein
MADMTRRHPETIDYDSCKTLLKRLGFTQDHNDVCDGAYGTGEHSVWSDDQLLALAVDAEGAHHGNNCLMLERKDCFNKWSQAPSVIRFPARTEVVLRAIEFLRSKLGHDYSDRFIFLSEPSVDVPREERFP